MSVWYELPEDCTFTLENAIQLADAAHASVDQRDKSDGGPYIRHPLRVMRALEPYGPAVQMAGVLHDVVEDAGITYDDLRTLQVPELVIRGIWSVSKLPGEPYKGLIGRSKQDPIGKITKVADNRDNGNERRLASFSEEDQTRFREKYTDGLTQLIEGDDWLAAQVPLIQARIEALYDADMTA